MKTRLYQLYDKTAGMVTGPIITEKKDGPAIRAFHAVLADNRTLPGRYPDQFQLHYLGEQDEETGSIDPGTGAQIVATGDAWLAYANHQGKDPEIGTWGQTSPEQ